MRELIILALMGLVVGLVSWGPDSADIAQDNFDNIVYVENSKYEYVGADGHQIKLINNPNATDFTYAQVCDFIKSDPTDSITYKENSFVCGDYAEMVHNNAEAAGLKCGWVSIDFKDESTNHACNAFNTIDKGIIFIDCTESDTTVNMIIGEPYIPERLFESNVEYTPSGIVSDYAIYW